VWSKRLRTWERISGGRDRIVIVMSTFRYRGTLNMKIMITGGSRVISFPDRGLRSLFTWAGGIDGVEHGFLMIETSKFIPHETH